MEILIVIAIALLSSLGGYGIGRTIVEETIFEDWVEKVKGFCFYPFDPDTELITPTGSVFTIDDDGNKTVLSEDGYRTDLFRPIALLLGKFADLLECVTCASAQAGFQLYFWYHIMGYLGFSAIVPLGLFATVGIVYLILNLIK